ncbi:MAG: tRNA (adenosine(37)-N6)-dimethylallyltransferase MiaA [Opitutaceae bacterium]|nr:tRNA (adenosine(37)-N6)-dimethylallyltransferase MiaA [Opitutaceae bacterium]
MPAPLHVLTGCTAVGKTELALAWAERCDAEIVSCDALLFYRGMDIGTAKPSAAERARAPHHLIDVAEVDERLDIKRYAELARAAVAAIEERGRRVLVVGGSGFYLKSFLAPVADDVAVDPALRAALDARLEGEGLRALVAELRALNPGGFGALDVQNPRRVLRALERCLASGATLEELARRFAAQEPPYPGREVRVVELAREPDDLRARIGARVRAMLEAGLIEEVRTLRGWGLERNPSAASAIGYRETLAWLDAGGDVAVLEAAITRNTWQLVRKQRTWFRTQLPAHRVVPLTGGGTADVAGLFE